MNGTIDKAAATRLLRGLENGGMQAADLRQIAEDLDPVLVHFVFRFLREVYPASNPAASAVLERLLALTSSPAILARNKAGEEDSVTTWFASEYSFADFRGRGAELIELIVDKLES